MVIIVLEKVYILYTHTGTKNVAKQMTKISQGRVRDKRVTWFPELADKSMFMWEDVLISISLHAIGKSIKTHLYWCMRNCEEKADHLKSPRVENIPSHYQVYFLH